MNIAGNADNFRCYDEGLTRSVGSKGANLEWLKEQGILPPPKFATIDVSFFKKVISQNKSLKRKITKLQKAIQNINSGDSVQSMAEGIRTIISNVKFRKDDVDLIKKIYDDVSSEGRFPVAVRSSATKEDLPGMSFAGMYDTFLNQRSFDDTLQSIANCFASLFNDRALQYYATNGLSILDSSMGIIVQKMVTAVAAGTAFSRDISTGAPCIQITSTYGNGESVVSGQNADSYVISPGSNCIIKMTIGEKIHYLQDDENNSGLVEKLVDKSQAMLPSLPLEQAKLLAKSITELHDRYRKIYDGDIDTEFAYGIDGKMYILQIRPLFSSSNEFIADIDNSVNLNSVNVLATGLHSVSGVSTGKLLIVSNFDDLISGKLKIHKDDIVVANRTENSWTQFFIDFSGIVTTEGNPTSHPMLIARERGVPCLVGVKSAVERLLPYDGQEVTLDGNRLSIYQGSLPIVEKPLKDVLALFDTVKPKEILSNDEVLAELKIKNRIVEDEQGIWLKPILYKLDPMMLDIYQEAIKSEETLINAAARNGKITIKKESKGVDGYLLVKWTDDPSQQIRNLKPLSTADISEIFDRRIVCTNNFLNVCKEFSVTVEQLQKFKTAAIDLAAYMDLSFEIKAFIIDKCYSIANELGIPQYFFEKYCQQIQYSLDDEDIKLKQEASKLAKKTVFYNNIDEIKERDIELYRDIVCFAKTFKVVDTENWVPKVPVENALQIINGYANYVVDDNKLLDQAIYFPQYEELKQLIKLQILFKFEQNRAHHIRPRGLFMVSDKLLKFGEKLVSLNKINSAEDILKLDFDELCDIVESCNRIEISKL